MGEAFTYFCAGDRARFLEGDRGAGKYATGILTLPVNQYMSQADVETVAGEVMAFLDRS